MEALTTLLWATQCFINNMEKPRASPQLDVTTVDVRRLSWELGALFQQREIRMARRHRARSCGASRNESLGGVGVM